MKLQNFKDHLETELRSIAPINYKTQIYLPKDPVSFVFMGTQDMAKADAFWVVWTKQNEKLLKQSSEAADIRNSRTKTKN